MSAEDRFSLRTTLPDGKLVRTVELLWRYHDGRYETLVFPSHHEHQHKTLVIRRAETEAEARANHDELVDRWSATEERKP